MKRFALLSTTAAFSVSAMAHPGHSALAATIDEWLHLLLGPDHLFGTLVAGALGLALLGTFAIRRARKGRRDDSR